MKEYDKPVNPLPTMPSITFLVAGIQQQLSLLDTSKASGPDNIHTYSYYIEEFCKRNGSHIATASYIHSII